MTKKALAFNFEPSIEIYPGTWYCEKKQLWWKEGVVYDKLSANHNGIIGVGLQLKSIIKQSNSA